MSFISYAGNLEDVILFRALKTIRRGFYIDVGAHHPLHGSVTRAFYNRGWRGINVEPLPGCFDLLKRERTRDININAALWSSQGERDFYELVDDPALSTVSEAIGSGLVGTGERVNVYKVPCTTLDAICAEHRFKKVHFLNIDVEGAEKSVLEGFAFDKVRPWVVVIEANEQWSTRDVSSEWEPLILSKEYLLAYYDGVNRFYVAAEHADLLTHFGPPPNVLDDYITYRHWSAQQELTGERAQRELLATQLQSAQHELAGERVQHGSLAAQLHSTQQELAREQAQLHSTQQELAREQAQLHSTQQELAGERVQRQSLDTQLQSVYASYSWRVTGPLRAGYLVLLSLVGLPVQSARWILARVLRHLLSNDHLRSFGARLLSRHPEMAARLLKLAGVTASSSQDPGSAATVTPVGQEPSPYSEAGWSYQSAGSGMARTRMPRSLKAVHQFHSGSAYGDAITNSMFLIQDILRTWGFTSEIYVDHVDPRVADRLKPFSEYVGRRDQLLLVHHSMGLDSIERILRVPDLKVLVYHNITPPELLPGMPWLQAYAELGRRQLAEYRDHLIGSIADSPFNSMELTQLGYRSPAVIPILIDIDALVEPPDGALCAKRDDNVFTIMFVGRVVPSKAQIEAVRCFAAFARRFEQASRLVLIGRADDEGENSYPAEVRRVARECGVEDSVVITGLVSDEDLRGWYRAADLYLSLSEHEGFGVPLLEAMAFNVPVLAFPAGSVSWVLGNHDQLLTCREPDLVAEAIHRIAADSQYRSDILEEQQRRLDYFRPTRTREMLANYLGAIGIAVPAHKDGPRPATVPQSYVVAGHANGTYSLALVNRALATALERESPGRVAIVPIEGQPTTLLDGIPEEERPELLPLVHRQLGNARPGVSIVNHYPPLAPDLGADLRLALFFWEESVVPEQTVSLFNTNFDAVLVSSPFVKKVLIDCGTTVPIAIIPLGVSCAAPSQEQPQETERKRFRFLHVSSCFPRKGVDLLLRAYAETFDDSDSVELVIKTFPNPHNDVRAQVKALRTQYPRCPAIDVIEEDISAGALADLYLSADAVVLPTRGESFNIPAAEAMLCGVPVITTAYGGQTVFCSEQTAWLVDYRFDRSGSHLRSPHSLWVEPDVQDLGRVLLGLFDAVLSGDEQVAKRIEVGRRYVSNYLTWEKTAEAVRSVATTLLAHPQEHSRLRLAWVSTWGVRCGIAEYSHYLLRHFDRQRFAVDIYADQRAEPATQPHRVMAAWSEAADYDFDRPLSDVANSGADAVVIQYNWGFFSLAGAAAKLAELSHSGRVVVLVLHATRPLEALPTDVRQAAVANLQGIDRILVHSLADVNRLKTLGLVENVTLFPHGALAVSEFDAKGVRRELGIRPDALTIGSYGFFLPPKGISQLIEAFALVRRSHPDARLILANAEYPAPESANEISRCRKLAEDRGVDGAVYWSTDFKTDEESLRLLGACDMVVFPYQGTGESASGAIRIGLASGKPVLTSPLPIFDELEGVAYRLSGTSAEDIARGILDLAADEAARRRHSEAQRQWLHDHDWERLSLRLQNMIIGLVQNRHQAESGEESEGDSGMPGTASTTPSPGST